MKNSLFVASALAVIVLASPIADNSSRFNLAADSIRPGSSDANILAFALTLEHLETAFYDEGIKNFSASDFDGLGAGLYDNILRLFRDEQIHVDALTNKLNQIGKKAPGKCQYKFPYSTAAEYVALSAIIEGVSTSAYAGASTSIRDKGVLAMAASILPVEARHDAVLRMAIGVPPYASAFDTPLDFNQAYTLASQFIVPGSCPDDNNALQLTAFPSLAVASSQGLSNPSLHVNATILLKPNITNASTASSSPASTSTIQPRDIPLHKHHANHRHKRRESTISNASRARSIYAAFLTADGPKTVKTNKTNDGYTAQVPEGTAGQVCVLLVNDRWDVSDRNTIAGPAVIEVADILNNNRTILSGSSFNGTASVVDRMMGGSDSDGNGDSK